MTISESIQSIGFLTDFRESALVYPIVLSTHLTFIGVFGGMILMTDLRLLGVALTSHPVADIISRFRIWKRIGFCIMVTAGTVLGTSEAVKYAPNPFFWTKMTLLILVGVHALVFRPIVYNNPEEIDRATQFPARARWAGGLSLALW